MNERDFFHKMHKKTKIVGKMNFLSRIKQTNTFELYLNVGNDNHYKAMYN